MLLSLNKLLLHESGGTLHTSQIHVSAIDFASFWLLYLALSHTQLINLTIFSSPSDPSRRFDDLYPSLSTVTCSTTMATTLCCCQIFPSTLPLSPFLSFLSFLSFFLSPNENNTIVSCLINDLYPLQCLTLVLSRRFCCTPVGVVPPHWVPCAVSFPLLIQILHQSRRCSECVLPFSPPSWLAVAPWLFSSSHPWPPSLGTNEVKKKIG